MTDDFSNPAKRAARIRMREQAQRLVESGREFEGMSQSERIERFAEAQELRNARRSGAFDRMNGHFQGSAGRLLTGFEPAQKKERDKLEATAKSFQYSPQMEVLLGWEAKGDPRLDKIEPSQRMALGFYRRSKDAARKLGMPTGKPEDDGHGW